MAHASSDVGVRAASDTSGVLAQNGGIALFADTQTPQEVANEAQKKVTEAQLAYATAKKAADDALTNYKSKQDLEALAKSLDDTAQAAKKAAEEADNAAKSTLSSANDTFTAANEALSVANDAVTAQEKQLETDKQAVTDRTTALETARKNLAENTDDSKIDELTQKVAEAQKNLAEANFAQKITEATLEIAKDEVASKTTEVESAKKALDEATTAQEATAKILQEKTDEADATSKELASKRNDTETAQKAYSGDDGKGGLLKDSNDALDTLNNAKTAYNTAMQDVNKEAQNTLTTANATKDAAQKNLESANSAAAKAKEDLAQAESEKVQADDKFKAAQTSYDEANAANTTAQNEFKTAQDKAKEIGGDKMDGAEGANGGTLGKARADLTTEKGKITGLETAITDSGLALDDYKDKSAEELKAAAEAITGTDETATKQQKALNDLATAKENITNFEDKVKDLEGQLDEVNDKLPELEKTAQGTKDALDKADTALNGNGKSGDDEILGAKKEAENAATKVTEKETLAENAQKTADTAQDLYNEAVKNANTAQSDADNAAAGALLAEQATAAATATTAKANADTAKSTLENAQQTANAKAEEADKLDKELQGLQKAADDANADKAEAELAKKAADEVAAKAASDLKEAQTNKTKAENDKDTADKALNGENGQGGAIKAQAEAETNLKVEQDKLPDLTKAASDAATAVSEKETAAKDAGIDESIYTGKTAAELTELAKNETDNDKQTALNNLATEKAKQETADKAVSDQNNLIGEKQTALNEANTALEKAKSDLADAEQKLVDATTAETKATAAKNAADNAVTTAKNTLDEKTNAATEAEDKIADAEKAANDAKAEAEKLQEGVETAQKAYDTAKDTAVKEAQKAASAASAVREAAAKNAESLNTAAASAQAKADKLAEQQGELESDLQAKKDIAKPFNDAVDTAQAEVTRLGGDDGTKGEIGDKQNELNTKNGEVTTKETAAKNAGIDESIYTGKTAAELQAAADSEQDTDKKQKLQDLADVKKEAETLDGELTALKEDLKTANDELSKAQEAAKQPNADIASVEKELAQVEKDAEQAKNDAQTAQTAADTANEILAQADADVKNLDEILADLDIQPEPQPSLPLYADANQQALYSALADTLANSALSPEMQQQAIKDIDSTLKESIVTLPRNMMRAFKVDTFNTPLTAAYASRLTATSEMITSDAANFVNPMEKMSETQFFFTPFGGLLKASELDGSLLGFSFGLTHIADEYITQAHFSYGRGKSSQELTTQSTDTTGNLFQVGGFTRLFYGGLETDINLNFMVGNFDIDNSWVQDSSLNSNAHFSNYQTNLGVAVGKRFGEDLSIKPFVGLQGYYESQDEFLLAGLGIQNEAYNATMFDALVGLEGRYIFENGGFVFAKASYENKLYNSHKEVFMRVGNQKLSYENESYDNVIGANIGARVLSIGRWKLDIEGIYRHYNSGLNYFGGNIGAKVSF